MSGQLSGSLGHAVSLAHLKSLLVDNERTENNKQDNGTEEALGANLVLSTSF